MNKILCHTLQFVLILTCASYWPGTAVAQVASTFLPSSPADWFVSSNWSNGIPNGPGDAATFRGGTTGDQSANLTNAVTLGQLLAPIGRSIQLVGTGPLTFDNSPSSLALLQVGRPTMTINFPIGIAAGQQLEVSTSFQQVTFNGPIMAGISPIHKTGGGNLLLAGNSSTWDGIMTVSGGTITVNHSSALGSSVGHTAVNGGEVLVNQPISEPMVLSSGLIQTTVHFLDFAGRVSVPAGSTGAIRGPFELLGGSDGAGDLRLVANQLAATTVAGSPLTHSGGLFVSSATPQRQFADIRMNNTYRGKTTVNNVELRVWESNGLGTTDMGTEVTNNGSLWLAAASHEDVLLQNSTLTLWRADATLPVNEFAGQVTLRSSTLSAHQEFGPVPRFGVAQPVLLDGGVNTIAPARGELVLNGIAGAGDLVIDADDDVYIAGLVEHDGLFEIHSGPVHFTAENAYDGSLVLRGRMIAEADQRFQRITVGGTSDSGSGSGSIEVAPGAAIEIGRLDMVQGVLKGDIRPDHSIEFSGFGIGVTISNLTSGADVLLHAGQLELDDSDAAHGATTGAIHVMRESEAVIMMDRHERTIHADLHLNNGSGFAFGGALRLRNDGSGQATTIAGDIHLGDRGAYIGGESALRLEGEVLGCDLILGAAKSAGPVIHLVGGPASHTGKTSIRSGELALSELGRLTNTRPVEVTTNARLAVDIMATDGPLSDRIADDVPVELYGGELSVWPTQWGQNSRERVGHVAAKRGMNFVHGWHAFSNSLQTHADLVIGELEREPGAIVSIVGGFRRSSTPFTREGHSGRMDVVLETRPALVNGILPAWFVEGNQFTTYDTQGRVKGYDGPFATFASANETSIVRPPSSASTLDRDITIHALYAFGNVGPIDLGGHTLTVGSGGISGATLSNGTIRPGAHSNGELIFVGGVNVAANIVDNGFPTSVLYGSEATVSGINTYTGTTYVMNGPGEDVRITQGASLPSGGDVEISGWGSFHLRDFAGYHYQLGIVGIRDGSTLSSQCCDNLNYVQAERIELESGRLSAFLEGETPVVKTTDGIATIATSTWNPQFHGTVEVHDGLLIVGDQNGYGYHALGQSDVTVHEHGRIALNPTYHDPLAGVAPTVTLNGGALYGGTNPLDGQDNFAGIIDVVADSKLYLFDGTANDIRQSDLQIEGRVNVGSGATLEILGRAHTNFGPELNATQGVHIAPGGVLAGDGAIRGTLEVSNGAKLSPGAASAGSPMGALAMNRPILVGQPSSTMIWGSEGGFRWEINDAEGDAGAYFGNGWDLVIVRGELRIEATPEAPFIIELVGLPSGNATLDIANLAPGEYRWKIVDALSIIGFDPAKFVIDASQFDPTSASAVRSSSDLHSTSLLSRSEFWLTSEGGAIYINAAVIPEPATVVALLWPGLLLSTATRARSSSRCLAT